ncbi:MAG: hypothetical protein J0I98_01325 [Mesorhizobium sp.]|nr:hypothetical protein [Mesorhizobium sp.]MBN9241414.1 hypothetical protein [Mesorhizobium sp.]MBN9273343.1 hypothetical protein [Mesorhizobium sp.]
MTAVIVNGRRLALNTASSRRAGRWRLHRRERDQKRALATPLHHLAWMVLATQPHPAWFTDHAPAFAKSVALGATRRNSVGKPTEPKEPVIFEFHLTE